MLLATAACTFDGSGLGAVPQTGGGGETTLTGGPVGEVTALTPTSEATDAASGTDAMGVGTGGSGGDPTTAAATTGLEATTEPGGTTAPDATTEPPCEMAMLYYDGDGDGFGDPNMGAMMCVGTTKWVPDNTDCNDMAAYAHPGFGEQCDTIDNDCDGLIDEYHMVDNPTGCMDCTFHVFGGHLYYFCAKGMSWDAAEMFCAAHGLHLAKDDGQGEHAWLLQIIGDGGLWWIGGNDKAEDGKFRWVSDNTAVPYPGYWGVGQPDNAEWIPFEGADCVVLVDSNGEVGPWPGGRWSDGKCGESRRFICEGPVP